MGNGKLRDFIKKAAKAVPGLLTGALPKLLSGNILGALSDIKNTLQGAAKDSPEAAELLTEFDIRREELGIDAFRIEVEDRNSAREMYKTDNSLQNAFAYFSIAGFSLFLIASMVMSYKIMQEGMEVNEFVIMTISNGQGVFTGLLFTLKDFLFGGSKKD